MPLRNTPERWGWLHKTIHWLVAIAVICQLIVGLRFSSAGENDPLVPTLYAAHGTLGLTILTLMLVRLAWRLSNPVPRLPDTLKPVEKRLARANHWLFYVLLIALPIGGFLMANSRGYAVEFLDWKLPLLIGKNEALAPWFFYAHASGALLLAALIVLHVAAALRHEFILKDNVLRRMTPLPERPAEAGRSPASAAMPGARRPPRYGSQR